MKSSLLFLLLAVCVAFSTGCAKDKNNNLLPGQGLLNSTKSSIRLFNFYGTDVDVTVSNIPLTSYATNNTQQQGAQANQLGLSLFPSGSWTEGSSFTIPSTLVDKQGNAHIRISPTVGNVTPGSPVFKGIASVDTVLKDDPVHPRDYYVLYTGQLKVVPRSAAAPAEPDHFKIRVLNLANQKDTLGLMGPVSLTFADGSHVSPITDNVPADTSSTGNSTPYAELPMGAYQFKLFYNGNTSAQLAEFPLLINFNACGAIQPPQEAIFPRVKTFKAGGTYSIVVTRNYMTVSNCNPFDPSIVISVNSYRIINEQVPAANSTFACMDAANALNLPSVSLLVDGQPLASNLPVGGYAPHKVYVWGSHHIQALDQRQQVIAEKDITLYPNDYLTAWTYLNPQGAPDIVFSSTDMTSTLYQTDKNGNVLDNTTNSPTPVVDDGTSGSLRVKSSLYNWQTRFLNLSEDIPYVTFGTDLVSGNGNGVQDVLFTDNSTNTPNTDSSNFASATINLARGVTNNFDPFVIYPLNSNSFFTTGTGISSAYLAGNGPYFKGVNIRAYQSQPGPPARVPGVLLAQVPPIPFHNFVANPAIYNSPLYAPLLEAGFYTVALIGKASDNKGRLIYIKHNQ